MDVDIGTEFAMFLSFSCLVLRFLGMASHGDGDMNDLPSQLGTWIFITL